MMLQLTQQLTAHSSATFGKLHSLTAASIAANDKYSERQIKSACNGTCTCTSQYDPIFFSHLTLQLIGQLKIKQEKNLFLGILLLFNKSYMKEKEDIDVDLELTVMKPLHAQWLVNLYHLLGEHGQQIILKGWNKAGIVGIFDGNTVLPPMDPCQDIYKNQTV